MLKHFASRHAAVYEEILRKKMQLDEQQKRKLEDASTSGETQAPKKIKPMSVVLDLETIQKGAVEMVTVNGRPFKALDDSGFRKIMDPLLAACGEGVVLNSRNVPELVSKTAIKTRDDLRSKLKGKLVSIKIDGATHHNRSIIGVNIQFIENGAIQIRTLAMKEVFISHTAANLKRELLEILERFDLTIKNIYSITTDNAPNVISMAKMFGFVQPSIAAEEIFVPIPEIGEEVSCFSDNEETEDTEEQDNEMSDFLANLLDGVIAAFNAVEPNAVRPSNFSVQGMSCLAHTMQLAVEEALKDCKVVEDISDARKLVKKLRTPTISQMLRTLNLKVPAIDCETRWCSTHNMVDDLLELEKFCRNMAKKDKMYHCPTNYGSNCIKFSEHWNLLRYLP